MNMTDYTCKVIGTSNFGDEAFAEYEVARFVKEHDADGYCEWLNSFGGETSPVWYRVVDVDKRLWRGMEDLV